MTTVSRILSTKETQAEFKSSPAHFYAYWLKLPGFPRKIKLGLRKNGYVYSEIVAFLEARAVSTSGVPA